MSRYATSTRVALVVITLLSLTNTLPIKPFHAKAPALSKLGPHAAGNGVIINEVDSDTPGTDVAEFIELYDGGLGNTPLDGYVVVLFNGGAANDSSYAAFDLDGFATNANGFFTLGNATVPGVDLVFVNGGLQNGPDAVALFAASATDFPNGTAITTENIRDALVYSNAATIDAGLLVLLNAGQTQINENAGGTGATVSMQRMPNGSGGARNTATYQTHPPTPDRANVGPTAAPVALSGRITDASGRPLRNTLVVIEGGGIGSALSVATGSFGYYIFDGLEPGTYLITVNAKRHHFAVPSRTVNMVDNVVGFDFVAEPQE